MSKHARWVLFAKDVAAIWTEEERKLKGPDAPEVSVERVHDCTRWSKPTPPGSTVRNRYEDHPIPYPRESPHPRMAVWSGDQEDDLRAFWHDRMGPGLNATDDEIRERRTFRRTIAEPRLAEWQQDRCGVARSNTR